MIKQVNVFKGPEPVSQVRVVEEISLVVGKVSPKITLGVPWPWG